VLKSFLNHIEKDIYALKTTKSLLAVSGGRDSMVLWDIFHQLGLPYELAHCNFGLRGTESDAETALVQKIALERGAILHIKHIKNDDYLKKESTQEGARRLRYDFFNELRTKQRLNRLVTAHHLQDQWEHFFIYLSRNNNDLAMRGMTSHINDTYRPLLQSSAASLNNYVDKYKVQFLNDSSNLQTKYLRNKVRHFVIPSLPWDQGFLDSLIDANEAAQAMQKQMQHLFRNYCDVHTENYWAWPKSLGKPHILAYILKDMGLHYKEVYKILKQDQSGKTMSLAIGNLYFTHKHIIYSREAYISPETILINLKHAGAVIFGHYKINWTKTEAMENLPDTWYLNPKSINSLEIRCPKKGDTMDCLGGGTKKLKDIFINHKHPFFLRQTTPILVANEAILACAQYTRSSARLVEGKDIVAISLEPIGILKDLSSII
jgi:tRNA(Ile)-lysidine synthase